MFGYDVPMTGLVVLGGFIANEIVGMRFFYGRHIGYFSHFAGMAAGAIAALLIRRENAQRRMTWQHHAPDEPSKEQEGKSVLA